MTEGEITLRVLGDCGKTHASVEEWQQCFVCGMILSSRLKPERTVRSFEEMMTYLNDVITKR